MTIAILATGDEIIQGDTLNTNGHAIAHALHSEGLPLGLHVSCSDQEHDIFKCIDFLSENHDIVILIGGLGPTSDDRTRFALARYLNTSLVEFSEAMTHIQNRLKQARLTLNPGNLQQALFPLGAKLLPNPNGSAMGCDYHSMTKRYILLPGPPRECLPMFNALLPELEKTRHNDKQLIKWRLFGVAEGEMAEILEKALSHLDCETGYRLETPYLEFKVWCKEEVIEAVKSCVDPLIRPHVIASPEQKASEGLRLLIEQLKRPIVILDDVSGGLLQTLIQRPSNVQFLSFHDHGAGELHFHVSGLHEFWTQKKGAAKTTITIKYHNDIEHGSETHAIPYRSPLVVDYASEWLSFRLLHLINQLHQ